MGISKGLGVTGSQNLCDTAQEGPYTCRLPERRPQDWVMFTNLLSDISIEKIKALLNTEGCMLRFAPVDVTGGPVSELNCPQQLDQS